MVCEHDRYADPHAHIRRIQQNLFRVQAPVHRHRPLSYVRNIEQAKDIVSDSFLYVWENRDRISFETRSVQAYILITVKHKCLNALLEQQNKEKIHRHIYHKTSREEQINLLKDDELTLRLFSREIQEIFQKELSKLPELTARVFVASRLEDQTYQEIAARYGITVRQVTREMQRALASLRVSLKDYLPVLLLLVQMTKK